MARTKKSRGFSLIEMLLVLAIIGIISGIAIPSFMGQRRRAKLIGDAQANAQVLRMGLESRKADLGLYASVAVTNVWDAAGNTPAVGDNLVPDFSPKGNSKLDFKVEVAQTGLSYVLTVTDHADGDRVIYQTNQNGEELQAYR